MNRASLDLQPICATKMWMPPTAGTRMRSTACTTWIWIIARARRVQRPSHTTILTRMLTTNLSRVQARRRPCLPHHQDTGEGLVRVEAEAIMGMYKAAAASGRITIVNAGEGAGAVVVVVGDAVGHTSKKAILNMERKTVMPMVLDHCRLPRRLSRKQQGNIPPAMFHPIPSIPVAHRTTRHFPRSYNSSALLSHICSSSSNSNSRWSILPRILPSNHILTHDLPRGLV